MINAENLIYTCLTNKKCFCFQLFSYKIWIKRKFELLTFGGWGKLKVFLQKAEQETSIEIPEKSLKNALKTCKILKPFFGKF